MNNLAKSRCEPCDGNGQALKGEALQGLLRELGKGWKLVEEHHLQKEFAFPDFRQALRFTNVVGEIAEEQQHHPDIYLTWGKVGLSIWSHKVDGLTESDFILAAKVEEAGEARTGGRR